MVTLQFFVEVYFGPDTPLVIQQQVQRFAELQPYNPLSLSVFAEFLRKQPEYRDLDHEVLNKRACSIWGTLIVRAGGPGRAECGWCRAPFCPGIRMCDHNLKYYVIDRDWLTNLTPESLRLLFNHAGTRKVIVPFVEWLATAKIANA